MFNTRLLVGILLLLLTGVIVFFAFRTKVIEIDVYEVTRAPLKVTTREEGKTRVIDRYKISSPINAYQRRISLNIGDTVNKGQVLAILEPTPSTILDPRSRAQAEAVLSANEELEKIINEMSDAAKADLELATITYQRTIKLRKEDAVAPHEMDIAKVEKRRAEAIYRASQFAAVLTQYLTQMSRSSLDYEDIRQIEQAKRQFQIHSSVTGTILSIPNKSAGLVQAGQMLFEIGDLQQLEVEVEVLTKVAMKLKSGMDVEISNWGENSILTGVIKHIEPNGFTKISALGVEEQRVKVIVTFNDPQVHKLNFGDGYRVEARFVLWESSDVLQIPNSALFKITDEQNEQWAVFVVKHNQLEKRVVKIGQQNTSMTEVLDGLKEQETVVAYLTSNLKEGIKVSPRK